MRIKHDLIEESDCTKPLGECKRGDIVRLDGDTYIITETPKADDEWVSTTGLESGWADGYPASAVVQVLQSPILLTEAALERYAHQVILDELTGKTRRVVEVMDQTLVAP